MAAVIIALIIALVALSASLGLNGWLTYGRVKDAGKEADERVAQNETEGLLEREKFEHEVTNKALARSQKRAAALEELLFHELDQPFPDADLDPADHRTRVRRLAEAWRESEAGDPVPADQPAGVPDDTTAGKAEAPTKLSDRDGLVDPFPDVP